LRKTTEPVAIATFATIVNPALEMVERRYNALP